MADNTRDVTLRLIAKNLTPEAFEQAQSALTELGIKAQEAGKKGAAANDLFAKSQANINRLANEFTGIPLKVRADDYASAIARVGGVTKLTASEQQAANRVITEAIEKYRALGEQVPPHLQKLADATKRVEEATKRVEDATKPMGTSLATVAEEAQKSGITLQDVKKGALEVASGLGLAFGAKEIIGGVKDLVVDTFKYADSIKTVAERLHVSYTEAQQFSAAAKKTGADMTDVEAAAAKLNVSLGSGNRGTAGALADIGLNIDEMRRRKPAEAFFEIADAIKTIPDPLRQAALAQEIFGKGGEKLLPAIRAGFADVGRSASTMSEATVQRLADAKEAWEGFGRGVTLVTGSILGAIIKLVNGADENIDRLNKKLEERRKAYEAFKAGDKEALNKFFLDEQVGALIDPKGALPKFNAPFEFKIFEQASSAMRDGVAAARKEIAALSPWIKSEIDAGLQLGRTIEDLGEKYGLSANAQRLWNVVQQESEKASSKSKQTEEARQKAILSSILAWREMTATVDDLTIAEQKRARELLAAGNSEKVVAEGLGVAEASVRKLKVAMEDEAKSSLDAAAARKIDAQAWLDSIGPITAATLSLEQWIEAREKAKAVALATAGTLALGMVGAPIVLPGAAKGLTPDGPSPETIKRWRLEVDQANTSAHRFDNGLQLLATGFGQLGPKGQLIAQVIGVVQQFAVAQGLAQRASKALTNDLLAQQAQAAATSAAMASATLGISVGIQAAMSAWQSHINKQAQYAKNAVGDAQNAIVKGTGTVLDLIDAAGEEAVDAMNEVFDRFLARAEQSGGVFTQQFLDYMAQIEDAAEHAKGKFGPIAEAARRAQDILNEQRKSGEEGAAAALAVTGDAFDKRAEDLAKLADLQQQYADATTDDERNKLQQAIAETNKDLQIRQAIIAATTVDTTDEADALSAAILGGVAERMAAGESFVSALQHEKGAVEALKQAMDAGNVGGTSIFDMLYNQVALASDEIAGPLLTALDGYRKASISLSNQGLLTQGMFSGLTSQISQTQSALEAQGTSHEDVMQALIPDLQTAWELQQKFGYSVDESTQALIDEALASGTVGEDHKSAADQMLDATKEMTKAIQSLVETLQQHLTPEIEGLGDRSADVFSKMSRGLDDIRSRSRIQFTAEGNVVYPDFGGTPGAGAQGGGSKLQGFAEGTGGRFLDFGAGTHVILHGRERVMTEAEAGAPVTVQVSIDLRGAVGVDAASIDRLIKSRAFQDGLVAQLRSSGAFRERHNRATGAA